MHVDGSRVTVMGLGRFGGGVGVTRWLADSGARVLVTDLEPAAALDTSLTAIESHVADGRVVLRLGEHDEKDFRECDLVVVNPAVPRPWDNPFLRAAEEAGVPVTTEMRLLVERIDRARVIGVTGTEGKSTTTAMIHHILVRCGFTSHLGGNIGGSLLEQLDEIGPEDWVVLELSSAMLYWLDEGAGSGGHAGWSPHTAVLTNLHENHLDWHETFEHYKRCKNVIFEHQQPGDHAFRGVKPETAPPIPLAVRGRHNLANAFLAGGTAIRTVGVDREKAIEALADFQALSHRLQLVADHDGLLFYNDSKATTPQATCLAVDAFEDPAHVHLLAGGYDKKIDLSTIVKLSPELGGLYTIGVTGRILAEFSSGHAEYCETLETAAEHALRRMRKGDVLLLSPGCASWDQFDNYEQRGDAFCEWVRAHAVRATHSRAR